MLSGNEVAATSNNGRDLLNKFLCFSQKKYLVSHDNTVQTPKDTYTLRKSLESFLKISQVPQKLAQNKKNPRG